jgi:hypothetical protein
MVAGRAPHHDAWSAMVDVTLGKGSGPTTFSAGQRGGGDIESKHLREGACAGVTVDMRRFGHHSFFLD